MGSAHSSSPVVCHAMEWESSIEGGVKVSAQQQRKALERVGIDYTTDPNDDYDILHLNFPGPVSLYHLIAAKLAGKPVVVHAHSVGENIADTYRFSNVIAPVLKRYFSKFLDSADTVIAVSEYMKRRLIANGVDAEIVVVSNGVDDTALDGFQARRSVAQTYGVSEPVVVNLAQVYEIKGLCDFVEVGTEMPATDFVWFGPKHDYLTPSETKRRVATAPANVQFPGFIEDKRDAFALGDVFFFPTHRDNQPLAILEAMYCGTAIVTRDIPAFDGWLEHGEHCLKGTSVSEFHEQIQTLCNDPALRAKLGAQAREAAKAHTLETVGSELQTVYQSIKN